MRGFLRVILRLSYGEKRSADQYLLRSRRRRRKRNKTVRGIRKDPQDPGGLTEGGREGGREGEVVELGRKPVCICRESPGGKLSGTHGKCGVEGLAGLDNSQPPRVVTGARCRAGPAVESRVE